MTLPLPTVGRTVHYVSHGTPPREDGTQAFPSACRAAIITEVATDSGILDGLVGLCVLNPTGFFFHSIADGGCTHSQSVHEGGTWHWPEGTVPGHVAHMGL